jgi:hypothetical protein
MKLAVISAFLLGAATASMFAPSKMAFEPAFAQPVQYQFTPPPPVQPLPFHPF